MAPPVRPNPLPVLVHTPDPSTPPRPSLSVLEKLIFRVCDCVKARRVLFAACVLTVGFCAGPNGALIALVATAAAEGCILQDLTTYLIQRAIQKEHLPTVYSFLNNWKDRCSHLSRAAQRQLLDSMDHIAHFPLSTRKNPGPEELNFDDVVNRLRLPLCDDPTDPYIAEWHEMFGELSANEQIPLIDIVIESAKAQDNTLLEFHMQSMKNELSRRSDLD